MELSQLYFRRQLLLMPANGPSNEETILKREAGVAAIARSMDAFQADLGATATFSWQSESGQ